MKQARQPAARTLSVNVGVPSGLCCVIGSDILLPKRGDAFGAKNLLHRICGSVGKTAELEVRVVFDRDPVSAGDQAQGLAFGDHGLEVGVLRIPVRFPWVLSAHARNEIDGGLRSCERTLHYLTMPLLDEEGVVILTYLRYVLCFFHDRIPSLRHAP
jgi:hypothetical protein